jgi:CMP-N,N'-diacetyllegionaminic acid synthase
MSRICTVCARAGSKGLKNKNIRDIAGKPLIAYTLEQAQASHLFDVIAVSSDSAEILEVAQKYGAHLLVQRPVELATDTAAKLPAIRHCLEEAERVTGKRWNVIVDLDVTSPLRLVEDIKGAVHMLESKNVANVITGAPARRSPYFNLVELDTSGVVRLSKPPNSVVERRQDSPRCFDMNASIYVWQRIALLQYPTLFNADTQLYVMPEERSTDIDSELDSEIVELLIRKRNNP